MRARGVGMCGRETGEGVGVEGEPVGANICFIVVGKLSRRHKLSHGANPNGRVGNQRRGKMQERTRNSDAIQ